MSRRTVHQCECPNCQQSGDHPDKELHHQMNLLLSRLDDWTLDNPQSQDCPKSKFYGSDRKYGFLTARPDFRLPDISDSYLERYIRKCNEAGIQFNYTLNSIYPGLKRVLHDRKQEIINRIKFLGNIGVRIITVSNPIMAMLIREANVDVEIEVSTIAHIDTVTQIKAWKENSLARISSGLSWDSQG
jgi:hypothetical protein